MGQKCPLFALISWAFALRTSRQENGLLDLRFPLPVVLFDPTISPPSAVLLRNKLQGLANCALPLPRSLVLLVPDPAGESLPGVYETAAKNEKQVEVDGSGKVPGERGSMVLSNGGGATSGASADGGGSPADSDRVSSEREDNRTGMEMLADHVRVLFFFWMKCRISQYIYYIFICFVFEMWHCW